MQTTISLYKPVGYTPLELIQRLKITHPEYSQIPLGYAGRLDPMAEGVLVILVGEENKKRKTYELLPKKYTVEVLLGVETDTYDIMGLVTSFRCKLPVLTDSDLTKLTKKYLGTWEQSYPPYSSPRVNGKPLFYWARHNALSTITIPKKNVTVETFKLTGREMIRTDILLKRIHSRIARVKGDFRQKEILHTWNEKIADTTCSLPYASFDIQCSSGLYVRSLAHELGKQLGTGAIALSIVRTAVGQHTLDDALRIMDTS